MEYKCKCEVIIKRKGKKIIAVVTIAASDLTVLATATPTPTLAPTPAVGAIALVIATTATRQCGREEVREDAEGEGCRWEQHGQGQGW